MSLYRHPSQGVTPLLTKRTCSLQTLWGLARCSAHHYIVISGTKISSCSPSSRNKGYISNTSLLQSVLLSHPSTTTPFNQSTTQTTNPQSSCLALLSLTLPAAPRVGFTSPSSSTNTFDIPSSSRRCSAERTQGGRERSPQRCE